MRRQDQSATLSDAQARVADKGIKAMMPIGRPFLDYVLSTLADAGYKEVCLVVGPEHDEIRRYYTATAMPSRLRISFATQEKPLGTADAVASAEEFVAGEHFLAINSDNHYPEDACRALRMMGAPGLAAFASDSLVRDGGIDIARVAEFAVVESDAEGYLLRIVERPDRGVGAGGGEYYVSMNCWMFGPSIFPACAAVRPSPRGELELPDAVQYAVDELGEQFRVLRFRSGVLDISRRADVPAAARRLAGQEVRL
jgi:dTDP-glucose pyrophosphorylase